MASVYLEETDKGYIVANSGTKIYGSSSLEDMGIIQSGVKNIYIGSTLEKVSFSEDVSKFKFLQGFGSNLVVQNLSGETIINLIDVEGKKLLFNGLVVDLNYSDGSLLVNKEKIEKIDLSEDELLKLSTSLSVINNSMDALATIDSKGVKSLDSEYHWDDLSSISYSFNESIPTYYHEEELTQGFKPLNPEQKNAVRSITKELNDLLGITLNEVSEGGVIRFSVVDMDDNTAGFAFLPSTQSTGGDVFLSSTINNVSSTGYGYSTIVHELGHALGLKHPFEGEHQLPSDVDNTTHSVMSYTASSNIKIDFTIKDDGGINAKYHYIYPELYALYDISTLHTLYGANETTNGEENHYHFNFNNFTFSTIWDSGGNDTIDLSTTQGNSSIDLNGGSINSIDVLYT